MLPTPCPPGTYNTNTASTSSAACTNCPGGIYCSDYGTSNYNSQNKCAAGYLCIGGSDSAYPIETVNRGSNNRKCGLGKYWNSGDTSESTCGAGTFQNSYGQSSCKSCPPGYYWPNNGMYDLTSYPCNAGYMCYGGATIPNPTDGTTGEICPAGAYCTSGSAKSLDCADGTKTTTTGNIAWGNWDAGTYCIASVQYTCPTRRYCVAGSVRGSISLFNNWF